MVGGVIVATAAVGAVALTRMGGSGATQGAQPTYTVRQGPLTISVVESGTIKSLEQVSLKVEVEGQTTLIYLVPEGTRVSMSGQPLKDPAPRGITRGIRGHLTD